MTRLLLAPTATVLACSGPASPDTAEGVDTAGADSGRPVEGVVLSGVTWAVDWRIDVLESAESGAWRVTRPDGGLVEVERGWAVLYVAALEPCEGTETATRRHASTAQHASAFESTATDVPPPPHALSAHPSAMSRSVALSLHDLQPRTLETLAFEADRFCEAGVGFFRADGGTDELPEDVDLAGLSLYVEGRHRPAGATEWTELELSSSLPAVVDVPLGASSPSETPTLSLIANPGALVENIDLDGDPDVVSRNALTALATSVTTTLTDP